MSEAADLARPNLPRPGCRVKLVCGPPASGKTTYVRTHAAPSDIVVDFDLIAAEFGLNRQRSSMDVLDILVERNHRLAALADEPRDRTAWVVLTAPSSALRVWWCRALGVDPKVDLVLLAPDRGVSVHRIMADPERKFVRVEHIRALEQWWIRERKNDPGVIRRGVTEDGWPTDPLHRWNW
jgi:hypothetical protein